MAEIIVTLFKTDTTRVQPMKILHALSLAVGFLAAFSSILAQDGAPAAFPLPPAEFTPSRAELNRLAERNDQLLLKLRSLKFKATSENLADVEIYHGAVDYILRNPDQFFKDEYYANAMDLIEIGLRRAEELARGKPSWPDARGSVCFGYRSGVDGSVQPYCMWVPDDYDPRNSSRLDVILHGRSRVLNEVSFLTSGENGKIVATETGRKSDPGCLKLYVFGRGNTSYRWVGEADVFEALASVRSRYNIDPERIVLRGFSMGGTGAWHLGLHFPSRWAAVEAGAGFVRTRPEVLDTMVGDWKFESLAIHDASNCSVNMIHLPFVAYVGSRDSQRAQIDIIRSELEAEGYSPDQLPRGRFLIGPDTGHNFRPEQKQVSDAFLDASLPRKMPEQFRFVTYTPAYGEFWDFRIDSLENLYERAELTGTKEQVKTRNIRVLKLDEPRKITLDGQAVEGEVFYKSNGSWREGEPRGLRKRTGLQGPIDDAFQTAFLCVQPSTGSDPVLEEFRKNFHRYLHGEIRVKAPADVTPYDVANYHLILFGDPNTNPWIRQVLPGLPLEWTASEIRIGNRSFPVEENIPVLIYPNPLNPTRYVVLNTGHTFPEEDVNDMHWFLHPRLGDYAILDKESRAVRVAGYFNEKWQLESK